MNDLVNSQSNNDPFFSTKAKDSVWNACIGAQGDVENYVDGYIEAALELVSNVIEKQQYIKRDTLAMPILYNARHALELSLKYMHDIFLKEGVVHTPQPQNHDILSYWTLLSSTKLGDAELTQHIQNLEIYVTSLSNIDDDGQELRYATNKDGQKSLKDKALCNLVTIQESLLKLQTILSDAKYRLKEFVYERVTDTYTKDLSRKDLEEISKMLPPLDKWKEEIFDDAKTKIKEKYSIGSNKFSAAINLIKDHRTMASYLGKEFDLAHLSNEKIKLTIQEWKKLHNLKNKDSMGINFFDRCFDAMLDHNKTAQKVQKNLSKLLSSDEIADLEAVFYIGREAIFCEFYEKKLTSIKKEHTANKNLDQEISHLIEKTNFLDCVVNGLKILGKPELAQELSL